MKNRLLKDTLIYGGGDFLFKFISFAVFPLYAYTFSLTEFGIIELISTTVMFFSGFYSLGLNFSTLRLYWDSPDVEYRKKLISTGLWFTLIWSFFFATILILILILFRDPVSKSYSIQWELFAMALTGNIATVGLQYIRDVLRIRFEATKYFILTSAENLLKTGLALSMIYFWHTGIQGYFLGTLIGVWVVLIIGLLLVAGELVFSIDKELLKKSVSYGMPVIIGGVATWIYSVSDRWLLAQLSSNEQVGLYAIAYKFAMLLYFMYIAFGMAFFPYAMKQFQEQADFPDLVPKMLTNWMSFMLLTCVAISAFAAELLYFTTPETYWDARNLVMFASCGYWVFCSTHFSSLGLHLSKKTKVFVPASWGVAVVNVLLNLLLVPYLGAMGSSIATLIANLLLTAIYFYFSQQYQPFLYEWRNLLLLCLLMSVSGALILYANQFPVSVVNAFVKAITCFVLLFVLIRTKLIDMSLLTRFLGSFLNRKVSSEV